MSLGCKCVEAFCCFVKFIQAIIVFYDIDCVAIKFGAELILKCEVGLFSISNDARNCDVKFFSFLKSCDDKLLIDFEILYKISS